MTQDGNLVEAARIRDRSKVLDYIELMKPELTGLSVLTALCGFFLASDEFDAMLFAWVGMGTLLVGGGAGALNQYMEREFDSLMRRTERRPLPAGRLSPRSVFVFGVCTTILGLALLAVFSNLLTAALAFVTISSYLFVYTPLKRRTPWATLVGGIPGALPPVMGWTAAVNEIEIGAILLFGILFFWQIPHFLSLAWVYRKDYARAGYRMLSVLDEDGTRTSRHNLIALMSLTALSVTTSLLGITGTMYLAGALLLAFGFVTVALLFHRASGSRNPALAARMNHHSRHLFFASLIYLPALLFLMTVDKL